MVKQYEPFSTERLFGHFTNKGDNHGRCLFTLMAFRAGEPVWCLTHLEGRVGGFNFSADSFGGGTGGDAMDDEAGPSLADLGQCYREFGKCIFKDCKVWCVVSTQMLGRNCKDEVVCGSDICQNEGWVCDVVMAGDGFVDNLECRVGGFLPVVWYGRQAKENQSVRSRERFRKDSLLPSLLLALDLRKLLWFLLLCYLCVGRVGGCWGFCRGSGWSVGLGGGHHGLGSHGSSGGRAGGEFNDLLRELGDGVGEGADVLLYHQLLVFHLLET